MTQISLSKAYAILDEERGKLLAERKEFVKGTTEYQAYSRCLRIINKIKREYALVSDADQLPLGL